MPIKKINRLACLSLLTLLYTFDAAAATSPYFINIQGGVSNFEGSSDTYKVPDFGVNFTPAESVATYGFAVGRSFGDYFTLSLGWKNFGKFKETYEADLGIISAMRPAIRSALGIDVPADVALGSGIITDQYEIKGIYTELLAHYPIQNWTLFAKLGYTKWRTHNRKNGQLGGIVYNLLMTLADTTGSTPVTAELDTTSEARDGDTFYGLGISYSLTKKLKLLVSYDRYHFEPSLLLSETSTESIYVKTEIQIEQFNAGVVYRF